MDGPEDRSAASRFLSQYALETRYVVAFTRHGSRTKPVECSAVSRHDSHSGHYILNTEAFRG